MRQLKRLPTALGVHPETVGRARPALLVPADTHADNNKRLRPLARPDVKRGDVVHEQVMSQRGVGQTRKQDLDAPLTLASHGNSHEATRPLPPWESKIPLTRQEGSIRLNTLAGHVVIRM